jgi:hypothetical protein
MSKETEWAWAAGFFDGEGSTSVLYPGKSEGRPEGYACLHVKVSQKDRRPLERFQAALGMGSITGPYQPGDIHCWQKGGKGANEALELLWPYLSEPKREQIQRARAIIEADLVENPRDHFKQLRDRIVQLRAEGLTTLQIASAVGRSRRTISYHLQTAGKEVGY